MATNQASIPAALRRRRDYAGPALFSYGFRPFFLGAPIWAALGILLWLPQYFGELTLPTAFGPLDWHRGHRRLSAHGHSQLDRAPALVRIAAAFAPSVLLFHIAAFAWIAAFAGFAAAYGPLLIRHPPNWAKC
jgi:uncharacterized protein involved in response to NO